MADDPDPDLSDGEPIDESELFRMMTERFRLAGASALSEALEEWRVARGRRLFQLYLRTPLWHPLEEVLGGINATAEFLRLSPLPDLQRIAVLGDRVRGDVELAFDGLLVGVASTVSDAMRDVMESELLIRSFAFDSSSIAVWASADADALRSRFSAGVVRRALAEAAALTQGEQIPDAWEYEVHSEQLHATPSENAARGKRPSGQLEDMATMTVEIVLHGHRFLKACAALYDSLGVQEDGRPSIALDNVGLMASEALDMQASFPSLPARAPLSRVQRREALRQLRLRKDPGRQQPSNKEKKEKRP